jgi:hypothetical protein
MLLDQDQIRRLLEIGERHREELVGFSTARTFGSDPEGEEAASSTPASCDAVSSGERVSL